MFKDYGRLETILKKIVFIEEIVLDSGNITKALEDEKSSRPAMMMHFTSIADQFNKLAKEGEFEILQEFDKRDLKGTYDMQNYIVHDYEGLNLSVLDMVIRDKLPVMKRTIEQILKEKNVTI
jgi:uncharacterized protein with HEPN domain